MQATTPTRRFPRGRIAHAPRVLAGAAVALDAVADAVREIEQLAGVGVALLKRRHGQQGQHHEAAESEREHREAVDSIGRSSQPPQLRPIRSFCLSKQLARLAGNRGMDLQLDSIGGEPYGMCTASYVQQGREPQRERNRYGRPGGGGGIFWKGGTS